MERVAVLFAVSPRVVFYFKIILFIKLQHIIESDERDQAADDAARHHVRHVMLIVNHPGHGNEERGRKQKHLNNVKHEAARASPPYLVQVADHKHGRVECRGRMTGRKGEPRFDYFRFINGRA